jgi:acetyltransferase-like isoleucine patch superfamily enzyme
MPNTKIGKGSLVAAYSYVKGEFPDFSIISGNPAKVIGDTRDMDERQLKQHPELRSYYDDWTKDN